LAFAEKACLVPPVTVQGAGSRPEIDRWRGFSASACRT
jgi:hypothetical protein